MSWIPIVGGAVSGLLQGSGESKPPSTAAMLSRARALNPQFFNAMGGTWGSGTAGTDPYQRSWYNMMQNPGYIDPALMNAPLLQAGEASRNNMNRVQGMLGRSGMQGGLANAYGMANLGMLNKTRAGIGQQYALWREQQRRSDMGMIEQMRQAYLGMGNPGQQQPQQNVLGNMIQGGLAAYGAFGGGGGGGGQQQQQPQQRGYYQYSRRSPWV